MPLRGGEGLLCQLVQSILDVLQSLTTTTTEYQRPARDREAVDTRVNSDRGTRVNSDRGCKTTKETMMLEEGESVNKHERS